jgi:MYXO-CTERM domain-containing protein
VATTILASALTAQSYPRSGDGVTIEPHGAKRLALTARSVEPTDAGMSLGSFARRAVLGAVLAIACLVPAPASAYSTESIASDGCHEAITFSAIRGVRLEHSTAGPVPAVSGDEQALLDDLPFLVPTDMLDLGAVTAVLGNRNVDLRDNEGNDLDALAPIHGDPKNQDEHCLRAPGDDEPGGDQAALDRCRAFIRSRALAALDGLRPDGTVDPSRRVEGDVFLELRGVVEASLPVYWWEIGRALHAVQDGFSHTYRSQEDPTRVIAVLNYVEYVEDDLDEAVDGPPHSSPLDRCQDLDELRKQRIQLAVDASADLLRATLDPALSRAEKELAVEATLDRYFVLQNGCTAENGWCGAPEAEYSEDRGCVCSAAGAPSRSFVPLLVLGLIGIALWRRRTGAIVAAAALIAIPATADAQEQRDPEAPKHEKFPLGVHLAGAGSVAKPAAAASLGIRYRLGEQFLIGVDGEYNPFYSETHKEFRRGVTNVYATGVLRFPMTFEAVDLRSTLAVGISRMNFDLYGVPEGSIGPFIGFNLLGIDIELARQFYLVVNPAFVAIPIPQTTGVPYSYPQYRISLGFQLGA